MWKRTVNFKLGLHKKNIASTNIELLKCRSSVHIHLFLRSVLKSCRHKMFPVLLDRHVEEFNLFFEDHSNACNLFQLLITMDQKLYVHFAIHRCLKVLYSAMAHCVDVLLSYIRRATTNAPNPRVTRYARNERETQ